MDQNTNSGIPPQPPVVVEHKVEHKNVGPIITVLIVILIIIIAALYIFASKVNQEPGLGDSSSNTESVQPVTNVDDDVSSISTDLEMSTDGLDEQNF